MSGYRQGKSSWCDEGFYPVVERIGQGLNSEAPLLVDVGGGIGHDLLELRTKHQELTGLLVLQDQADVIKQAGDFKKGIEVAVHDFFTPQPIKGMPPIRIIDCITLGRQEQVTDIPQALKLTIFIPFFTIGMMHQV